MQKTISTSVLASFATLKSLSDENKYQSPYQILREFIRYVIITRSLRSFTSIEMKNYLNEDFGFSIPEAVIKTSAKGMSGVSLDHGIYSVDINEIGSESLFEQKKKLADSDESYIIQLLSDYISHRIDSLIIDEQSLTHDLIRFLTDDELSCSSGYMELIGEFVLKYEQSSDIQQKLDSIREGSILYIGLSHNIGEIGSIKKSLAIYLGTEILFSISGYNGIIYKQLASDFFQQVRLANSKGRKKITLYYFSEIKKEIEDFFNVACEIVDGKRHPWLDRTAMQAITNGCKTSADVKVKQADFYHNLQFNYGITEDPHENYYDDIYYSENLESLEYEEDKSIKEETAIKLISHINKLRKGNRYNNEIECEHIIVTNARITLLLSKKQVDSIKENEGLNNLCAFAVSLDRITSLLWYKLGSGFSDGTFPSSIRAILRARTVLSSNIAKKAEKEFFDAKKQFESGILNEEQIASRIIMLRNKPSLPEDLNGDDIDEIMNFSPEYLSRYEEQVKQTQSLLQQKESIIELLKAESEDTISKKDATIASQEQIIKEKSLENDELKNKLYEYQQKESDDIKKQHRRKSIWLFIRSIILKLVIIVILSVAFVFLEFKLQLHYFSAFIAVADLFYIIRSIFYSFKNDYRKFFTKES